VWGWEVAIPSAGQPTRSRALVTLHSHAVVRVRRRAGANQPETEETVRLVSLEDAPVPNTCRPSRVSLGLGIRLLADLRDIFTHAATGVLRTTDILTALNNLDESPWGDLEGKPLDARCLAKELARYNVKPKPFKVQGESVKGYQTTGAHGLADAWDRYLPPPSGIGNCGNCGNPAGQAVTDPHPVTDASVTPARSLTP
jgi:hypothetical protein